MYGPPPSNVEAADRPSGEDAPQNNHMAAGGEAMVPAEENKVVIQVI